MHATWIEDALFAGGPLPAVTTTALVWPRTIALAFVAAGRTNWLQTIGALPAGQADYVALLRASVVAVDVVAWPAEDVALFAVVVCLAGDPIRVGQRCNVGLVDVVCPFVLDRQPAAHRVLDYVLLLVEIVACCG